MNISCGGHDENSGFAGMRRVEIREDAVVFACPIESCGATFEARRCRGTTRAGERCLVPVTDFDECSLHREGSPRRLRVEARRRSARARREGYRRWVVAQRRERQRDKIVAMRAEGKTYRQIAAEVRCSLSTVQSALYAAGVR